MNCNHKLVNNTFNDCFTLQILTNRLRQKSNAEWNELFGGKEKSGVDKPTKQRAKFPYGPVNNLSQVFQDPQVKFSEMETTMEHDSVGTIKQVKQYSNMPKFFFTQTNRRNP